MNISPRFLVLSGAAALSLVFAWPSTSTGFSTIGGNLGIATTGNGFQRDVRVWNNAADAAANNNVTAETNHPGALGAPLSVWKAAEAWNSNTPAAARNFDFDWQGGFATSAGNANSNTVFWGTDGCGGGTLAYTVTPISDGWFILMCENWTWADGPGSVGGSQIDIQGVAAHELGHALGLGHSAVNCGGSCASQTTMCPAICGSGTEQRTIAADDQAGLNNIYGAISGNKPTITAISGTKQLGSVLTITGTNFPFPGNLHVKFTANTTTNTGAIPGLVQTVPTTSATTLNVTIPNTALDGNVLVWNVVANPDVLSNPFPIDIGGVAPPPAPILFTASPFNVEAFQGGTVTLTGDNLTGATSVAYGANVLTSGFTVVDDNTITLANPVAPQLGFMGITATTAGGTSNQVFLTVIQTDPLTLVGSPTVVNGGNLNWSWGGDPNKPQFLLVNFTGQTITYQSQQMLNFVWFVPFGNTNAVGLGSVIAPITGAPIGLQLHMQILTATSEADVDLSNVTVTTVQ